MEATQQAVARQNDACTAFKTRSKILMTGSQVTTLGFQSYMAYRSYKNHKSTLRAVGAWFGYGLLIAIPLTGVHLVHQMNGAKDCEMAEELEDAASKIIRNK